MANIHRKVVNDILPIHLKVMTNQYIPRTLLPVEVLDKCLKKLCTKGWIDMQSVYTLEQLLNLCGTDWFSESCYGKLKRTAPKPVWYRLF
jgi:hypothetical protein